MAIGLGNVQAVLGSSTPISEKEIKDALWYYYFDEEKTTGWLLGAHSLSLSPYSVCSGCPV